MLPLAKNCGRVEKSERVAESFLECQGNIPLSGVRRRKGDNICIDLNSKEKNSFLIFIDLKKLENIVINDIKAMLSSPILETNNETIIEV